MPDETPTETAPVEIDGALYDAETGEFLAFVDRAAAFAVVDQASAEWVLGKMLDAEAALAAVLQSPEVLRAKAVLANAEALQKASASRLDSLHRRFDGELGDYARRELEGKKGRTLKTLLGSISLKTVKGGLRVADEAKALAWAKAPPPPPPPLSRVRQGDRAVPDLRPARWRARGHPRTRSSIRTPSRRNPSTRRPSAAASRSRPTSETVSVKTGVQA